MTLRIYQDSLQMVRRAYAAAERIGERDRNLADQLRRASSSVPLNIAEGSLSQKGNRTARYLTAMASANETRAALQLATAVGHHRHLESLEDQLDKIIATLWKLTH